MVTRKPISPQMVERGARALWDEEMRFTSWDDASPWTREPYERRAQLVLNAAIPQERDFLNKLASRCRALADMLVEP